jgi:hypothetical protein
VEQPNDAEDAAAGDAHGFADRAPALLLIGIDPLQEGEPQGCAGAAG